MAKQDIKKQEFLPTPPIGYPIVWREQGGKHQLPALVVGRDVGQPGICDISVNWGNGWRKVLAVFWEDHPERPEIGTEARANRGLWAYMDYDTIPEKHYELHMQTIEAQEEAAKASAKWAKEQKELFEASQNVQIDPRAVEVARAQATAILTGSVQ